MFILKKKKKKKKKINSLYKFLKSNFYYKGFHKFDYNEIWLYIIKILFVNHLIHLYSNKYYIYLIIDKTLY